MDQYMPYDSKILTHSGDKTVQDLITGETKLMAFYFSMHDCPPCQEFTPIFAELYKEMNSSSPGCLECIFFSGDKTQELFDKYYGE